MKIETKMSGWSISDFGDIECIFKSQIVTLEEVIQADLKQDVMNYILDTFRFYKGDENHRWVAMLDYDTIYKISIMQNYPEIEAELLERFGENWFKCYLRFGH